MTVLKERPSNILLHTYHVSSARGLVIETKHLEFDESENTYINTHNATHNVVNIISIQKPHS